LRIYQLQQPESVDFEEESRADLQDFQVGRRAAGAFRVATPTRYLQPQLYRQAVLDVHVRTTGAVPPTRRVDQEELGNIHELVFLEPLRR